MLALLFCTLLSPGPEPAPLRPPELYSSLHQPKQEYRITKDTVILLDGKPATLEDLAKANAVITKMETKGDAVVRLEAKTPGK